MKLTPELYSLVLITLITSLMWVPYVLSRMARRGVMGVIANPAPGDSPDPDWADRCKRAHHNAIENLAVFAPIVLALAVTGFSTATTAIAASVYVAARLVHYIVYTFGIQGLRTLAFLVGWGATVTIAVVLLTSAA